MLKEFDDWKKFALGMSEKAFAEAFAHPFLLLDEQHIGEDDYQLDNQTISNKDDLEKFLETAKIRPGGPKIRYCPHPTSLLLPVVRNDGLPGPVTLGRSESNDIMLDHHAISKTHAVFTPAKTSTWLLEDLHSKNGTYIDGTPLDPSHTPPLLEGVTLIFGTAYIGTYFGSGETLYRQFQIIETFGYAAA